MNKKKRMVCLALILCIVFSVCSITGAAAMDLRYWHGKFAELLRSETQKAIDLLYEMGDGATVIVICEEQSIYMYWDFDSLNQDDQQVAKIQVLAVVDLFAKKDFAGLYKDVYGYIYVGDEEVYSTSARIN